MVTRRFRRSAGWLAAGLLGLSLLGAGCACPAEGDSTTAAARRAEMAAKRVEAAVNRAEAAAKRAEQAAQRVEVGPEEPSGVYDDENSELVRWAASRLRRR